MGHVIELRCGRCDTRHPAEHEAPLCPACGGVLECEMALPEPGTLRTTLAERPRGLWRWHELLPVADRKSVVTLGEGDTPLVRAGRLGDGLGLPLLYIKNDALNPTGSLKDRINTVACSHAREVGARVVTTASTGNQAASISAYAAAAGLECVVFVPEKTAPAKVAQAAAHGARLIRVAGPYETAAALFREAAAVFGWYSTLSDNPWRNAGMKTYAYEVWDQLGRVPDWLIHPEASGGAVAGAWKGFRELTRLGWIAQVPRMGLAQVTAAAPIVRAFERGLPDAEPMTPGPTIAESIRVGRPSLGRQAIAALRESGGAAVAVSDAELLSARDLLARRVGIFAEPAGAAAVAATIRLRRAGTITPDSLVVCVVTGHGLKQIEAVPVTESAPPVSDLDAVKRRLRLDSPLHPREST